MNGISQHNNRDWKEYNESPVKREETYLTLDFVENWNNELNEMDKSKKSRSYGLPDQFIEYMLAMHIIFDMTYRQMDGFTWKLSNSSRP